MAVHFKIDDVRRNTLDVDVLRKTSTLSLTK